MNKTTAPSRAVRATAVSLALVLGLTACDFLDALEVAVKELIAGGIAFDSGGNLSAGGFQVLSEGRTAENWQAVDDGANQKIADATDQELVDFLNNRETSVLNTVVVGDPVANDTLDSNLFYELVGDPTPTGDPTVRTELTTIAEFSGTGEARLSTQAKDLLLAEGAERNLPPERVAAIYDAVLRGLQTSGVVPPVTDADKQATTVLIAQEIPWGQLGEGLKTGAAAVGAGIVWTVNETLQRLGDLPVLKTEDVQEFPSGGVIDERALNGRQLDPDTRAVAEVLAGELGVRVRALPDDAERSPGQKKRGADATLDDSEAEVEFKRITADKDPEKSADNAIRGSRKGEAQGSEIEMVARDVGLTEAAARRVIGRVTNGKNGGRLTGLKRLRIHGDGWSVEKTWP